MGAILSVHYKKRLKQYLGYQKFLKKKGTELSQAG